MKRYLYAILVCLLTFGMVAAMVACKPTSGAEEDMTDEEASLAKLCEGMFLGESEARDLLALLEELGITGRVMFAYAADDEEERIYYHIWIGEGSIDVYLADDGSVAAVRQAGSLVYGELPTSPEEEEGDEPEDLPGDMGGLPLVTSVTVEDYTATVVPGGMGYLCAWGLAGVEYQIKVYYAGGVSTAQALAPKVARDDGLLMWEWAVSPQVKPGVYKIIVARSDDARDSVTLPFEVLENEQ